MALRVRVCRLADVVPGELRAFAVTGVTWPVIVTFAGAELVAVPGVCPHEDVGLADGELVRDTIICAAHGYRFDLHTGRCAGHPELELRRYPVTVVGDEVWVDLL
jgi:toluene monooxygenase system ferredoxin subunit